MPLNKQMLSLLVCPLSKQALIHDTENNVLLCKKSQLAYSICQDIPIMLPQEAQKIAKDI